LGNKVAQPPSPESKKRKSWGIFPKLVDKMARTPLLKEYYKNLLTILSNSLNRLIFLAIDLLLIALLLYLLSTFLNYATNLIGQLILLLFFLALLYQPVAYFYRSASQLNYETSLNSSIYDARDYIAELRKPRTIKNYRSLQGKINRVRRNLKDFVEYSEILSPPIFNYELDRLQQRIDIFFNCASEVLVPINKLFSRAAEFEQEMAEAQYRGSQVSIEEEVLEMEEANMRQMTGEISYFDLEAMDDFMRYLWIALFEKEAKRYSPLSFKHPVNLIVLSRFFDSWNSDISSCSNCKAVFEKASKDIEGYYKQLGRIESKRRQQIWQLRDEVLIVILSVGISTLVQYLIKLA
jgi:ABC-type multidrug transport system fused ATPase/permease subunit